MPSSSYIFSPACRVLVVLSSRWQPFGVDTFLQALSPYTIRLVCSRYAFLSVSRNIRAGFPLLLSFCRFGDFFYPSCYIRRIACTIVLLSFLVLVSLSWTRTSIEVRVLGYYWCTKLVSTFSESIHCPPLPMLNFLVASHCLPILECAVFIESMANIHCMFIVRIKATNATTSRLYFHCWTGGITAQGLFSLLTGYEETKPSHTGISDKTWSTICLLFSFLPLNFSPTAEN